MKDSIMNTASSHQQTHFSQKDYISIQDFTKEEIITILDVTEDVKRAIHHPDYATKFSKKYGVHIDTMLSKMKIAILFGENSTRTLHSFRMAAGSCGAFVDGFPTADYTSLAKGETWAHTAAMFANLGFDAIVMRSTIEGLPRWTAEYLSALHNHISDQHQKLDIPFAYRRPIIYNGGDGKNQHITQCFLDLFTMRELARSHGKDLEGLSVALLNDLAHGRTVASLMVAASLFHFELHFAYPMRFGPQQHRLDYLTRRKIHIHDHQQDFLAAMKHSFVAYQSRPQKERVGIGEDLDLVKRQGQITLEMYQALGKNAPYLMHPRPIDAMTFQEIDSKLDFHPKNVTDMQASNGKYIRITLLALGLGIINVDYHGPKVTQKEIPISMKELSFISKEKHLENPRTGFVENGVVIDHIPGGFGRRISGVLGFEKSHLPIVAAYHIDTQSGRKPNKDMIKIHEPYHFSQEQLEVLALLAPNVTISEIASRNVTRKYRPVKGSFIHNRISCSNQSCITNIKHENVQTLHHIVELDSGEIELHCHYCERTDTIPIIYKEERFKYIQL